MDDGLTVPLEYQETKDGVTLLQCFEPAVLLSYLNVNRDYKLLGEECYVKGVAIPGEGAFFDLFDAFGSLTRDIVRLTDQQSEELILSRIC